MDTYNFPTDYEDVPGQHYLLNDTSEPLICSNPNCIYPFGRICLTCQFELNSRQKARDEFFKSSQTSLSNFTETQEQTKDPSPFKPEKYSDDTIQILRSLRKAYKSILSKGKTISLRISQEEISGPIIVGLAPTTNEEAQNQEDEDTEGEDLLLATILAEPEPDLDPHPKPQLQPRKSARTLLNERIAREEAEGINSAYNIFDTATFPITNNPPTPPSSNKKMEGEVESDSGVSSITLLEHENENFITPPKPLSSSSPTPSSPTLSTTALFPSPSSPLPPLITFSKQKEKERFKSLLTFAQHAAKRKLFLDLTPSPSSPTIPTTSLSHFPTPFPSLTLLTIPPLPLPPNQCQNPKPKPLLTPTQQTIKPKPPLKSDLKSIIKWQSELEKIEGGKKWICDCGIRGGNQGANHERGCKWKVKIGGDFGAWMG